MQSLPVFDDPNLVVGAEGFSDAGVYRLRDDLLLVQSLDFFPPLVDDPFEFGQIAAANSLSDVYTMGGRPTTALNIVGFPDDQLPMDILAEILRGGSEQVMQAGAVLVGGHTVRDAEIKYGLSVTGVVAPDELLTNQEARPGDLLVLTKALGTGFVTTAFKAGRCPKDVLSAAVDCMRQLNAVGRDAAHHVGARAATDITGFGLAGHAGEMARASNVTVILEIARLPTLAGAEELARRGNKTRASASNRRFSEPDMRIDGQPNETRLEFAFDAQTSGGMLISVKESRCDELVQRVRENGGVAACVVGRVLPQQDVPLIIRA